MKLPYAVMALGDITKEIAEKYDKQNVRIVCADIEIPWRAALSEKWSLVLESDDPVFVQATKDVLDTLQKGGPMAANPEDAQ